MFAPYSGQSPKSFGNAANPLLKPVSWGHARDAEIFLYRSNSIRIPLWGENTKKAFRNLESF